MKENLNKFIKIYPWFAGLSSDLLFWIAIDTLFLTVVKKFNASYIVSLTTISLIVCILLQIPILKLIKKIGNTKSVIFGSFLLLLSSILLTFGTSYFVIVLGKIFYEIAFVFKNMCNAILKNNLELQGKNNFIKIKTKGNTIYAVITMFISFVAGLFFNINRYLPMYCCILFCIITFIMSFYIIDYSNFNMVENKKVKFKYNKLAIFLIISYGLFYPIVNSGQYNGKLFIQ